MGILNHDRIRHLRTERGLTQAEAATLAGMGNRARWNDVESGRRPNITMVTLEGIAKALKVEPAALLKGGHAVHFLSGTRPLLFPCPPMRRPARHLFTL